MGAPPSRRQALALLASSLPLAGALPCGVHAQTRDAAPVLKRGIGVHHLLNWPEVRRVGGQVSYVWPPFQGPRYQIQDSELDQLRRLGFDFLRLTVDPSILMDIRDERAATVERHALELARRLIARGFCVVFDLHPVEVNPAYGPRRLIAPGASLFQTYGDLVERCAGLLAPLPPERIAFEVMNEPWIESLNEAPRWQPMMEELHRRARAGASTLPLVVTGSMWSDFRALLRLDPAPFKGSNVFYTFHYYDPHSFTHQGVKGDDAQYLAGVPWPMTSDATTALGDAARDRIQRAGALQGAEKDRMEARSRQLLLNLERGRHDAARIEADFSQVVQWARRAGVGPERILLGEFGCVETANMVPVGASRLRWVEAVRKAAEKAGFPWAYWAYKGYGGMSLLGAGGQVEPGILAPLGLNALDH